MRHLYMDTRALYYDSNDGIPRDVKNRLRTKVKPDRENGDDLLATQMWELRLGASNSQGALSYIWEDQQMTTSRKLSLAEKFKMDNLRILDADYAKKEEIIKKQMTILSDQKNRLLVTKSN